MSHPSKVHLISPQSSPCSATSSKTRCSLWGLLIFVACHFFSAPIAANDKPARILHINSYHQGYSWSENIFQGIQSRLLAENIEFDTLHLDSLQSGDEIDMDRIYEMAEAKLLSFEPDVIITSNELATQYVIAPVVENYDIPIIYTGMHGDPSRYNFPNDQVTGIVEFAMVEPLVDLLEQYSAGSRVGLLTIDSLCARVVESHYEDVLNTKFTKTVHAADFATWKSSFDSLQDQVDIVILADPTGLKDWDSSDALKYLEDNMRTPIGATDKWLAPLSLITIAKIPQEQGWWAADIAVKLIEGGEPVDFPVTTTREAKLYINFKVAEKMGIVFSTELVEIGTKVEY